VNRFIAVACLVIALAGFGWTYQRVNKISSRLSVLTEMVSVQNDRLRVRTFAIKSQIAQTTLPIVFIGDSLTEGARLSSSLCGLPVVNAGIGGMTAASYARIAKNLFGPISMAVVAIGTNDALGYNQNFRADYEQLVGAIQPKKLVLVGLPPIEGRPDLDSYNRTISEIAAKSGASFVAPQFSERPNSIDGTHLSAAGYQEWLPAILKVVAEECAR
jgi:lysophospholipase L1-like esterase